MATLVNTYYALVTWFHCSESVFRESFCYAQVHAVLYSQIILNVAKSASAKLMLSDE